MFIQSVADSIVRAAPSSWDAYFALEKNEEKMRAAQSLVALQCIYDNTIEKSLAHALKTGES